MYEATRREQWGHTANVMALLANCHRDPKRQRRPFHMADFLPADLRIHVRRAAVAPLFYLADDSQILVRQEFIPKVVGPTSWEIGVRYGTEDDRKSHEVPEAGFWRFSFDTTGGTHKITQSLETIHRVEADPADPAPDLKQAIGWDGKRVNGVDVVVPKLEFDITA